MHTGVARVQYTVIVTQVDFCSFIYLHSIQWPLSPDFDNPPKYGIAPSKARNLRLTTQDGVEIGAWHILPDTFDALKPSMITSGQKLLSEEDYDRSLSQHPTIIYLHGNAANRAAPFRIASYAQFTARLQANVIAIDYRGFGDSAGAPSQEGLILDAMAAWQWVQTKRAKIGDALLPGEGVFVIGQSLGTGVASQMSFRLFQAGTPPQGVVLIAPYRSLRHLMSGYRLGGFLPILAPMHYLPFSKQILDWGLQTTFDSEEVLSSLYASLRGRKGSEMVTNGWPHLVISHASDDSIIPSNEGEQLYAAIVSAATNSRTAHNVSDPLTEPSLIIPGWAQIHHHRINAGGRDTSLALVKTQNGGHNTVGEGVVDIVREVMRQDGSALCFS